MRPSILLLLLFALSACARYGALEPTYALPPSTCAGSCADTAEITYLGVGGFLIRYGERAVLTAPFFSNQNLLNIALRLRTSSDEERVDTMMNRLLPPEKRAGIQAILVGHSHYDHLMDVPRVAKEHVPDSTVKVWGNRVMLRLLDGDTVLRQRLEAVDDSAAGPEQTGTWIYPQNDSTVRFMAIVSDHAPHVFKWKLLEDSLRANLPSPPRTAWHWAQGQPYAFVIEFGEQKNGAWTPGFRVYYQDSASSDPAEVLNAEPSGSRAPFDVTVICAASFTNVENYPQTVLDATNPRHVVISHWEDFFTRYSPPPLVPLLKTGKLKKALGTRPHTTPHPGATLRYCVCPAPQRAVSASAP